MRIGGRVEDRGLSPFTSEDGFEEWAGVDHDLLVNQEGG